MDIITKINKMIEKEIEFAKETNPQMALGMMQIQKNIKDIEESKNKGSISDGYHTFDELYYHRMVLFSIICNTHPQRAWKSWKHHDGTMYDNYFIVGITVDGFGDFTYHYSKEYWDMFKVSELEHAPKWDGHTSKDVVKLLHLIKD